MRSAHIWVNAWLIRPRYVFIYVCVCVPLCVLRVLPKEAADVVMNEEGVADGLGKLMIKPCLNRW